MDHGAERSNNKSKGFSGRKCMAPKAERAILKVSGGGIPKDQSRMMGLAITDHSTESVHLDTDSGSGEASENNTASINSGALELKTSAPTIVFSRSTLSSHSQISSARSHWTSTSSEVSSSWSFEWLFVSHFLYLVTSLSSSFLYLN